MPSVVLLDATPLAGSGCTRADTTYVRALIGDGRQHPERPERALGFAADRWAEAPDGVPGDAPARARLVMSSHPRTRVVPRAETVRQAQTGVAEARDG